MKLTQEKKDDLIQSLKTLAYLANAAENAGMFDALDAAKSLAREQIKFNVVIGEILCS
jgi:hypothetical protein